MSDVKRCATCKAIQAPSYLDLHDWTTEEMIQSLVDALDETIGEWPSHGRNSYDDPCECPYCDYVWRIKKEITS